MQHRVQVRLGHAVRALDADAQRVEAGVEVIVDPWPASVPRSEKDDDITTNLKVYAYVFLGLIKVFTEG